MNEFVGNITDILNKAFNTYIRAVSKKCNISQDELNDILIEILPGFKVRTTVKRLKKVTTSTAADNSDGIIVPPELIQQAQLVQDTIKKSTRKKKKNVKTALADESDVELSV